MNSARRPGASRLGGLEGGRPSRTAYGVALHRAAHQLFDRPLVLDDPIALRIVDPDDAAVLQQARGDAALSIRYLRAFIVARSRYAEDCLADAVRNGVCQYVVLGAGLDTFAYRNLHPGLRVFEVDHPATQRWKRSRLAAGAIDTAGNPIFAPVDFEGQTLADGLARAGFQIARPTFFSWLGVTPYLTREAVMRTFALIASLPRHTAVAFDYVPEMAGLPPRHRTALEALAARVAAAGEPFCTFFDPVVLRDELRRSGFSAIEDCGADEINTRYFAARSDGLRVAGSGRLMRAVV